jgi:cytochrome c peroxidase
MHDGSEATLEQVVELYDKGGRVRRPASIATEVHPLSLSAQDHADLVAFLLTLNSPCQPVSMPPLPR